MGLNRTRSLVLGLVCLFLGLQCRSVQSFTLTPNATRFVEARLSAMRERAAESVPTNGFPYTSTSQSQPSSVGQYVPGFRRVVTPPEWVSFICFSLGAVFLANGLFLKS